MHLTLVIAAAALAEASPWGPGNWHGRPHGWSKPSVYTPPGPVPDWPYKTTVETSAVVPTSVSAPISQYPTATASSSSTKASSSGSPPNACASVSKLQASYVASAGPSATATVPAALAWECITSVPFNSSAAVALMDAIRPYIDWQTTLNYVKDPPAEYAEKVQKPYDFWTTYEGIYEKAKANGYENERAFGWDLYRSFQRAHDGHFVYYPDSVNLVFNFGRTTPLVSVSKDGEQTPEVFVFSDVLASSFSNSTFEPSPLTMINGQDSMEWLEDFSQYGSLQDPDALWNNMFYLLAQVSLGSEGTGLGTFAGGGRGRVIYPGPETQLTFANGTVVTNENFASVLVPFEGIQNGEDIYKTFFTPPPPENAEQIAQSSSASVSSSVSVSSSASFSTSSSPPTTIPAPGYPSPIIREPNNLNSGYFLDGEGYDDVAVLSVPSFVGSGEDELPFQILNTYFLNYARSMGKKKLIIDVSANGGGTILQGYDLFKQLFPQILPYGASRYRAHEAFDLIGQEVSWKTGLFPRTLNASDAELASTSWNYRSDLDVNYEPFTSWDEKFGPHEYAGDNFTSLIRWNLTDPLITLNSGGIYVSGYLQRANITVQPFDDIVVVYDGYCASTCTIFSEFMRQQAGIKTVALGGRPNKDIIQAVGGVKGTNSLSWDYVLYGVEQPFDIQHYHDDVYYNSTALGDYTDLPFYRGTAYVVNARDGLREADETETPLQFVYEPADCRIYYTPEMAVDQTAAWKTVADTAFNGVDHCVAGSYGGEYNGGTSKKREARAIHKARRDVDIAEHYRAMAQRWAGKEDVTRDGYMPM